MTRRLVSCSIVVACAVSIVIASSVSAQSVDYINSETYNSKRSFFASSGFGTLAVLGNVTSQREARIENEYIALPDSGLYRIHRNWLKSPYDWWFIVNHRSGSNLPDHATYIGVLIVKRLKTSQVRPLELYRNKGWFGSRPDDGLDVFQRTYRSLENFFELQDTDSSQKSFEKEFGNWHAKPDTEPSESSWRDRSYWRSSSSVEECFQDISRLQSDQSNLLFQGRLIRFRVTTGTNSPSPVVWNIGLRQANAVFIKTFSPLGADFNGEYCVVIK